MKFPFKRALAAALALVLCAGTLTACSGDTGSAPGDSDTPGTSTIVDIDPSTPAESDLWVGKIEGLPADFVMGMDASAVISIEKSGGKYYGFDGSEQDVFKTLAEAGINTVRCRVWNDPTDGNGNGYGGGNCDINTAVEIGKRVTQYGMSLMVDFHYSDFWADPAKQREPKAWESYTVDEKCKAIYDYTKESMQLLADNDISVNIVQVGNETNTGFCGEANWANITKMMAQASKAIREVYPEAKIAVHFTNPHSASYPQFCAYLKNNDVDYDIFASSYYPYWHGTLENLTEKLKWVADVYDKEVMVAETSWISTFEDGDGHSNTVGEGYGGSDKYPASPQGQANAIESVIRAVVNVGEAGMGVVYWEGTWIPANNTNGLTGNDWETVYAKNKQAWEEHGSGWASSYSHDYDADAAEYYGGSAVDNQALFDFEGRPLESLNTFKYVYSGTTAAAKDIAAVNNFRQDAQKGAEFKAPETVTAIYNDMTSGDAKVTWNSAQLDAIDVNTFGEYVVTGTVEGYNEPVTMTVVVKNVNLLVNPGFEEGETGWETNQDFVTIGASDDPLEGSKSTHFYDTANGEFKVWQKVEIAEDGEYYFTVSMQGGAEGKCTGAYIYMEANGVTLTKDFESPMVGWKLWSKPVLGPVSLKAGDTINVGTCISFKAGGWGTIDDCSLYMD